MIPGVFSWLIPCRATAAWVVIALSAAAGAASPEQTGAGGRVRIDFRALTPEGTAVLDLRPEDVSFSIGGKPRLATSLELFGASPTAPPEDPSVPPPFTSNADPGPAPDRFLVIDEDGMTPAAFAELRRRLEGWLDEIPASDRVGLLSLRPGGPSLAPTGRRDDVKGALSAIGPRGGGCGTGRALDALSGLVRARIGEAPAVFAIFLSAIPPASGAAQEAAASGCGLDAAGLAQLDEASRGTPAILYFVLLGPGAAPSGADALAAATGGRTIRWGAGEEAPMTGLGRETSAYYVASVHTTPAERNGSAQPVTVTVSRGGVRTLARSTVIMPPGQRPLQALQPRQMARSSMRYRQFPIRAAAYPSSNYDGRIKIVVVYEPEEEAARMSAASLAAIDPSGRLIAQSTASPEDLARRPAVAAVVVPPGPYRLRVAATDATRAGGTVEMDVDARLTPAGPVTLSALALGGSDVLVFEPRLGFTDEPAAVAYLELYGVRPGSTVNVRFELAATPEGTAIVSMPAMLPPSSTPGRIATAALPIAPLPPGDYVVRALVLVDGQPVGQTTATLRKK